MIPASTGKEKPDYRCTYLEKIRSCMVGFQREHDANLKQMAPYPQSTENPPTEAGAS